MSKRYALAAQKRERAGKGIARELRRNNMIPAVIYGDNKPPVLISLPQKDLTLEYLKGNIFTHVCEMKVDGQNVMTILRDLQFHAVSDKIESADFLRVGPKTRINVEIPVHFVNEDKCIGLKNKGVLNVVSHTLELSCVVSDIPEHIEVDLAALDIGDSVKLSEVKLPSGAVPAHKDRDETIASIVEAEEYTEVEIAKPLSDEEVAAQAAAAAGGAAAPAAGDKKAAAPAGDKKPAAPAADKKK